MNKKEFFDQIEKEFHTAGLVVALLGLFWEQIKLFLVQYQAYPAVTFTLVSFIVLLTMASVIPIIQGMWVFVARSKIPIIDRAFELTIGPDDFFSNVSRLITFGVAATFFAMAVATGIQQVLQIFNLFTGPARSLPTVAFVFVLTVAGWKGYLLGREVKNRTD